MCTIGALACVDGRKSQQVSTVKLKWIPAVASASWAWASRTISGEHDPPEFGRGRPYPASPCSATNSRDWVMVWRSSRRGSFVRVPGRNCRYRRDGFQRKLRASVCRRSRQAAAFFNYGFMYSSLARPPYDQFPHMVRGNQDESQGTAGTVRCCAKSLDPFHNKRNNNIRRLLECIQGIRK
jgi:hypothetical protein